MTASTLTQQNLFQRDDISISLRFGYLGLGMGGCAIAAECADVKTKIENNHYPYSALLINTNKMDFEKITYSNSAIKKVYIGDGKGAARDIQIGEQAFIKHKDEIISEVKKHFQDRDFIWIVAGLGGGTGTGSIIEAIKVLHQNGYKNRFGLILTLPRNKEGSTVLSNALERLQTIAKIMQGMGSIILVDNQKLYDEFIKRKPHSSLSEYISFSNKYVANTLHELNVITASFKPYGDTHFDSSEFEKLIKTPGILTLSKHSVQDSNIDLYNESTFLTSLNDSITEGILSDGYKFSHATRAAMSVITNRNTAERIFTLSFTSKMESIIDGLSPAAEEKPIATYVDDKTKGVHFYTVFAGLRLPERITELVEENNKLIQLQEQDSDDDDVLSALSSFTRKKQNKNIDDIESLLNADNEDDPFANVQKKQKEYNPLDDLI
jgi:cell division GTPase FtsZ